MIAQLRQMTFLMVLSWAARCDNQFVRLLSDQVSISDSNAIEYVSTFVTPVVNKFTIFGWMQFKGTENRLYNILKFRNLNTDLTSSFFDSLNSILSISYSFNQIENKQFLAFVYANGEKQADSLAKIIEGPILENNAWNFFAVCADYDALKSQIFIKVFDKDALEASYQIDIAFKNLRVQKDFSVFLGKNNDPPNNTENFSGLFYNFYLINNYVERPEILYLFDSASSLDQFRGVYLDFPLYAASSGMITNGLYRNPVQWTGLAPWENYAPFFEFSFNKTSSAKVSGLRTDMNARMISSAIFFMKFSFKEPISDEFVILRLGEIGQANSMAISLVEEAKETSAKTFSQNLSVSLITSTAGASTYVYRPELNMPKRLKIQLWSANGKQATYMSSTNFLAGKNYTTSVGFSRYNDNILRFLYQEQKNYFISAEVKDFTLTDGLRDLVVADNASKDFGGSLSLKRLIFLDTPIEFSEALYSQSGALSGFDNICSFSTILIKDFKGCADCADPSAVLYNYECSNYCPLPSKNYNGVCQACAPPYCFPERATLSFNVTRVSQNQLSVYLDPGIFKGNATAYKLADNGKPFCSARLNNTNASLYTVDVVPSYANFSCLFTINPVREISNTTVIVGLAFPDKGLYSSDRNEILAGETVVLVDLLQPQDNSLETTGKGLAIFLVIAFYCSLALGLVFLFFVAPSDYVKWRLLYSVNYIHCLALLFFVNTELPVIVQAFFWTLYRAVIDGVNGAFNASILAGYRDTSQNIFAGVSNFSRLVYHGLTQHFVLNFLLIIVLQLILWCLYGLLKLIGLKLNPHGPENSEEKAKSKSKLRRFFVRTLRAFEWNILYYSLMFFAIEIAFFSLLNFGKAQTGFPLAHASLALAVIYLVGLIATLLLSVLVIRRPTEVLSQRETKRRWSFLYSNYLLRQPLKSFEPLYHARNIVLMLFLALAIDRTFIQTIGMFVVFVLSFGALWAWARPWKSWLMWVTELVPEACLGLVLLGYLILALNQSFGEMQPGLRAGTGAMLVSFGFIGVLWNAGSLVFWAVLCWKYKSRFFASFEAWSERGPLIVQNFDQAAYSAFVATRTALQQGLPGAKAGMESQRVLLNGHLRPERSDSSAKLDSKVIATVKVNDFAHSLNFASPWDGRAPQLISGNEEGNVAPMVNDTDDFTKLNQHNQPPKSFGHVQTKGNVSVITATHHGKDGENEDDSGMPRRKKVAESFDADDDDLNASDSLEVQNIRRAPPTMNDSNLPRNQPNSPFVGSNNRPKPNEKPAFSGPTGLKGNKPSSFAQLGQGQATRNERGGPGSKQTPEVRPMQSDDDYC